MRALAISGALLTLAVIALPDPSPGASLSVLDRREARQLRTLWRDHGTVRFFDRHPRLAHSRAGRRALRFARAELGWTRRELGETRAEQRGHERRRTLSSARPSVDRCLSILIDREGSNWDPHATNPETGAYGVPQALPGSKMAAAGPDWQHNVWTQIAWMRSYIAGRYGSTCAALSHSYAVGWY